MKLDNDFECMSLNDVTKLGKWSRSTTYKLINEGKLTTIKAGARTLVTVAAYKACIAALAEDKTAAPTFTMNRRAK